MEDRRELWTALGRRLLWALPLAAVGAWLIARGRGDADRQILGLLCIVADGFLLAPALAGLCAEPVGGLFHPRRPARPEPRRSIAESRRARGQYEEAIAAYDAVVAEFPGDLESWAAMVEIALRHLRDGTRGDALARRALLALRDEASRGHLIGVHRRFRQPLRDEAAAPGRAR